MGALPLILLLPLDSLSSPSAVDAGQVFVTATARCLDLATALLLENSVMLLTSPNMKQPLLERLDKYIFPADQVTITDVSDKCSMLTLMGPQADDVMTELAGVSGQPGLVCSFQFHKVSTHL
jgi:folate-binding Fe-S cluster repair protein YgfZ